jgi:hypothetical protein
LRRVPVEVTAAFSKSTLVPRVSAELEKQNAES